METRAAPTASSPPSSASPSGRGTAGDAGAAGEAAGCPAGAASTVEGATGGASGGEAKVVGEASPGAEATRAPASGVRADRKPPSPVCVEAPLTCVGSARENVAVSAPAGVTAVEGVSSTGRPAAGALALPRRPGSPLP